MGSPQIARGRHGPVPPSLRRCYIGLVTAPAALNTAALDAARRLVAIARARYPVLEGWLYGSHARGDAREDSEADVALVVEGTRPQMWRVGGELAEESFDVMMATGFAVSPLALAAADWRDPDRFTNSFLLRAIRRDGVAL